MFDQRALYRAVIIHGGIANAIEKRMASYFRCLENGAVSNVCGRHQRATQCGARVPPIWRVKSNLNVEPIGVNNHAQY